MSIKKKSNLKIIISAFLFFMFVPIVNAGTCSVSISGPDTIVQGKSADYTIVVSNINGSSGVTSLEGGYASAGNVSIINQSASLGGLTIGNNKFFWYATGGGFTNNSSLLKVTVKADAIGTGSINLSRVKVNDDGGELSCGVLSKNINVVASPSNNNNLKSLNVSSGGLNFSSGNTNYHVNVDSSVGSINIDAAAEHGAAKVSGTGNKTLNYGDNRFSVTVTAEDGSQKTYSIVVNRPDNRSSDNTLKSLKPNKGSLSPSFSSGTTTYSVNVDFDTTSINLDAIANDGKARVTGVTSTNLAAGKVTSMKITVTAENGSTKTYTMNVRRAPDPNKELSTNNYLSGITISNGTLAPVFNKETLTYEVIVSESVTKVDIHAVLADSEFGSFTMEGPESLSPGLNVYVIKVMAENGSERIYTINIRKDIGPSILLAGLTLKSGELKEAFNSERFVYYYTGTFTKEDVEGIAEDVKATVTVEEHDTTFIIRVTSSTGEVGIYVLIKHVEATKSTSFWFPYVLGIGTPIVISLLGYGGMKLWKKQKNKEVVSNTKPKKVK